MKKIFFLLSLCSIATNNCTQEKDESNHIWEGNLALPASQQPGALVAFGQNIVDKNDLLTYFQYEYTKGNHKKDNTFTSYVLYGINDHSSLFVTIPAAISLQNNNQHSSGIEDITVQYEYAFFNKNRPSYVLQATIVTNIGFPSGSFKKQPPTGFGSPSFFLGTTLSYTGIEWYAFGSPGITFTSSHHGNKAGNQYLYLWGAGKNIAYCSKEWLFTGIFIFNGTYAKRDKRNHILDKNSGGNTLLGDFLLWFSTKKLTAIGSISIPITQHLFGQQNKSHYVFDIILGWKFN